MSVSSERQKITRDFSRWCALSSTRSGCPIKSRRAIYPLLDRMDESKMIEPHRGPVEKDEFDEWHRRQVHSFVNHTHKRLPVGWAAKILNVYMKTMVYLGGQGRDGLVKWIHPPIDSGLWEGIAKYYGSRRDVLDLTHHRTTISSIRDYDQDYLKIIKGCIAIARDRRTHLIEVEWLWNGAKTK